KDPHAPDPPVRRDAEAHVRCLRAHGWHGGELCQAQGRERDDEDPGEDRCCDHESSNLQLMVKRSSACLRGVVSTPWATSTTATASPSPSTTPRTPATNGMPCSPPATASRSAASRAACLNGFATSVTGSASSTVTDLGAAAFSETWCWAQARKSSAVVRE